MGKTLTLKCPKCGRKFDWSTGSGFLEVETLHCDKCGMEKEWCIHDMVTDGDLDCPCGGMYTDDAPVRCPKCKKVIDDYEKNIVEMCCWD